MPPAIGKPVEFTAADGTLLSGSIATGNGPTALLMHGLTAHRGLVLMGSRKLQRAGWTVIAFDARGHGASAPAAPGGGYAYPRLVDDAEAILDRFATSPAVLIGASMGAHTAAGLAISRPDLCRALLLLTPAWSGSSPSEGPEVERWDRLAGALETGGIEAFVGELGRSGPQGRWSDLASEGARQRMDAHSDLDAVAAALREVPSSAPLDAFGDLGSIEGPTIVVGSRDEADPGHPLAIARKWAERIPSATLAVEGEGESPLAWRGVTISDLALRLASEASAA